MTRRGSAALVTAAALALTPAPPGAGATADPVPDCRTALGPVTDPAILFDCGHFGPEPYACWGSPQVPDSYWCIVRWGSGTYVSTSGVSSSRWLVLWYRGKCYYVQPDGTVYTRNSLSPDTCP